MIQSLFYVPKACLISQLIIYKLRLIFFERLKKMGQSRAKMQYVNFFAVNARVVIIFAKRETVGGQTDTLKLR